ncbi:MAG TPA: signal peptidase I [Candidatus Hydrogenedentes bacterium]|nr:signal peptidase I [Candidatus Hydrogenedentota bacterium]HRK33075.1 signal peptidase I [Candidatus Hydrogenedentota bacterium]
MAEPERSTGPSRARIRPARKAFYVVVILVGIVVSYWMGIRGLAPFRVPSESMLNALQPNDFIFTLPQETYARGDIVVLHDPLLPGGFLVKRIVGLPGDKIDINYGYLSINNAYASEPYIREPMNYFLQGIEVPDGEMIVLGDNRNESEDASRWLIDPDTGEAIDATRVQSDIVDGKRWKRTVPMNSIIGKVVFRYLPFSRFGVVSSFPLKNSKGE